VIALAGAVLSSAQSTRSKEALQLGDERKAGLA